MDFILGLSSLIKVLRYGVHIAKSRPWTSFACFSWILFNAVGRLSVALTGLTYSYDSDGAAALSPGPVNVTNWSTFSEHDAVSRSFSSTPEAERYSAHSYGMFSVMLQYQSLTVPGESDPNIPLDRPIGMLLPISHSDRYAYPSQRSAPMTLSGTITSATKTRTPRSRIRLSYTSPRVSSTLPQPVITTP